MRHVATRERGSEPRTMSSLDINTEDFSASVDFLASIRPVDTEKIGILGVCELADAALNATQYDHA